MRGKLKVLFLIIGIILLIALAGCKSKNVVEGEGKPVDKVDEEVADTVEDDEEKIMQDFKNISKSDNEPFVLVKFIDENIEKVSQIDADEMIKELEEVQERHLEKYMDQLFMEDGQGELMSLSGDQMFFDEAKIEEIKNANLKQLAEKIIESKYKLINMEGAFYPIIDYEALKTYNKSLSDETVDYINLKSMDSNKPTVIDAGLMITFDELAERLTSTENYIEKYPEGFKYEEVLRLYGVYLRIYLQGVDNTLIYDYDNKTINEDVLSSYKKVAGMENTVTSEVVSKYINIIEENQLKIDENVLSKVTELYNDAIGTLEEHK